MQGRLFAWWLKAHSLIRQPGNLGAPAGILVRQNYQASHRKHDSVHVSKAGAQNISTSCQLNSFYGFWVPGEVWLQNSMCVSVLQPYFPPNPKSFVLRNFLENVKEINYFRNSSTNKVDPSHNFDLLLFNLTTPGTDPRSTFSTFGFLTLTNPGTNPRRIFRPSALIQN